MTSGIPIFDQRTVATLPAPWSLEFLPDGRMLVTERPPGGETSSDPDQGEIRLVTQSGLVSQPLAGVPDNVGVLDITLDPDFVHNHLVYFSFIESDPTAPRIGRNAADTSVDPAGIAVARAVLDFDNSGGAELTNTSVIWRQTKVVSNPGSGEPGGRLAFSPDGTYLYIAAGDRQEFDPVQSLENTLGKIIRIYPDGTIPADNPFVNVADAKPEIWTLGHRNPYGLVFDSNGLLWEAEMGPKGGDELNVIQHGDNYGWPYVSYGNNYDDSPIPKPAPGDGYDPSAIQWTPVIAPSSMISYSGTAIPAWTGDLILSGLQSHGLVIVDTDGSTAEEVGRLGLGARTRDVVQGPDGTLWVLLDQPDGRLVQLSPSSGTSVTADATGLTMIGNALDNVMQGHASSDILTGGLGRDIMTGGGGSDLFRDTAAGLNGDTITDFTAGDKIRISDADIAGFAFSLSGTTLTYTGGSITLQSLPAGFHFVAAAAAGGGVDLALTADAKILNNGLTGDFNGDGKDDLLWHSDGGQLSNWLGQANGGFAVNDANALTQVDAAWKVVGAGDFNGDGREDILWRNPTTGQLSDWTAKPNGGFAVNDANALTQVDTAWKVVGTGDFNGDGKDDILWRSDSGQLSDWLGQANGGFLGNDAHALTQASTDWKVVGTGDFNGDGKDDILWRNAVTGQLSDWLGKADGGFTGNDANAFSAVSKTWHVVGTGDFNGDGREDILWRNDSGQFSDWLGQANGGFIANDANAFVSGVPLEWQVAGVGDYNGDGRSDILWRNADTGALSDWLGQANGGFAGNDANALVNGVPLSWHTPMFDSFAL